MYMKSMKVTDYSTGTSYTYGDKTGNWQSITAKGGKVNGNSGEEPTETQSAPEVTATVDIPEPWSGTHKETSAWVTPDTWPWVATEAPSGGAASTGGLYRPSGYDSGSHPLQPPSGVSLSEITPEPKIPMETNAKTGILSQYISPFTSVPLVSSSAVSSHPGLEGTAHKNVTRHATTKTKNRFRHHKTYFETQDEPTATVNLPLNPTASRAGGDHSLGRPFIFGWSLSAFLGGVLVFL